MRLLYIVSAVGRYGAMMSVLCPVKGVAEDTAGGAEEAGAQGEA